MKRIYNALVLNADCSAFFSGEITVDEAGRIAFVGERAPGGDYSEEIDAEGAFVLPGFKNAHTHRAMTFLRSRADD